MKITGSKNRVQLIAGKVRCGIAISAGPWISGVNPDMIKIRAKRLGFPKEIRQLLAVENGSDSREDYFECDSVRLFPGHPLYEAAKAAAM